MHIHFIGVGGVSMSALAKYLFYNHFIVTGSDKNNSYITDELQYLGVKVYIGHRCQNCYFSDVVIYNSAIGDDNPELNYAKQKKIPCIDRAELLRLIAKKFPLTIGVSGSHGKTTVTSLLAHILSCANKSFTAHIGGYDKMFGNYIDLGEDIFLSEVCEFKRNIDKFSADIAVSLNIDNDHLNCYKNIEQIENTFFNYLDRGKFRVINCEDAHLCKYANKAVTFGIKAGDYCIDKIEHYDNNVKISVKEHGKRFLEIFTDNCQEYNLRNLLAAISTARTLGIKTQYILEGIKSFSGVKRRNEFIGKLNGAKVIADYCHHPTEIRSFLSQYLDRKNILVIFQTHTYSRTKFLFKQFIEVLQNIENLYLFRTYAAREKYDYDGSSEKLSKFLPNANYYESFEDLFNDIKKCVNKNNIILVLGAGDIYEKFCSNIS